MVMPGYHRSSPSARESRYEVRKANSRTVSPNVTLCKSNKNSSKDTEDKINLLVNKEIKLNNHETPTTSRNSPNALNLHEQDVPKEDNCHEHLDMDKLQDLSYWKKQTKKWQNVYK